MSMDHSCRVFETQPLAIECNPLGVDCSGLKGAARTAWVRGDRQYRRY